MISFAAAVALMFGSIYACSAVLPWRAAVAATRSQNVCAVLCGLTAFVMSWYAAQAAVWMGQYGTFYEPSVREWVILSASLAVVLGAYGYHFSYRMNVYAQLAMAIGLTLAIAIPVLMVTFSLMFTGGI